MEKMIKSVDTISVTPLQYIVGEGGAGGIHNNPTLTAGIAAGTSNDFKFVI